MLTEECSYPSSKTLLFISNGDQHSKTQLDTMEESKESRDPQIVHLLLREHHRREERKAVGARRVGRLL